jgi:hypothetical protein
MNPWIADSTTLRFCKINFDMEWSAMELRLRQWLSLFNIRWIMVPQSLMFRYDFMEQGSSMSTK